jgi:5-methyltetrahydropteroyltriglutamate--homocysteine methyltransferase
LARTIRADHVGSLLRPPALLEARAARERGEIPLEALRAVEDAAILDALAMQREAGVEVCSDGEMRRRSWMSGFYDAVEGLAHSERAVAAPPVWKGVGAKTAMEEIPIPQIAVRDKLRPKARITGAETPFLGAHAQRVFGGPFKITMPSPSLFMRLWSAEESKAAYPTRDALLDDLIDVYLAEVDAVLADGAGYVQLDTLRYLQVIDPAMAALFGETDSDVVIEQTLRADNAVLARAKAGGAITALHVCRGNHRSAWTAEGGYEPIAERVFAEAHADRFLLEFDDARSGGFEPLRFVPKGKTVALGLITTKTPELEDPETLRRRVDEASRQVALDDLALTPQCGFASTYKGNLLSPDDQRRKLELVADTARMIWG